MNRRNFLARLFVTPFAARAAATVAIASQPVGLGGIVGVLDAPVYSGTVGAINRATFAYWRNQQVVSAASPLTFDALRKTAERCV